MQFRNFSLLLVIISTVLCLSQFLLVRFFPELGQYQDLFWISLAFFIALTILSFLGGKHFVMKTNKNAFFQFIMLLIFVRLFASATLVIGYFQITKPDNKLFLLPFFLAYLTYTIFEVYFLTKIGREN
jgi:hypothetical protein